MPPAELHIASLLVHVRPESVEATRDRIAALQGVEIHAEQSGKMVVTVEGPHEGRVADRMTDINLIGGVLSVVLVFHHVAPEEVAS